MGLFKGDVKVRCVVCVDSDVYTIIICGVFSVKKNVDLFQNKLDISNCLHIPKRRKQNWYPTNIIHNLHCHCFSTIYQLIISLMMTSSLLYRRPVTLLFCEKFLVHSEDADDFKFVIQKTSHFFWGRISWFIQRVLIFFLMTTYNITTFIIEYFFLTLEGLITT
jgi:hypothetical protein